MKTLFATLLILALSLPSAWAQTPATDDTELSPVQLLALRRDLQARRERISDKAIAYLWDTRLNTETGTIGKVQPRYLQALAILALAADGKLEDPVYADRLALVAGDMAQPLSRIELGSAPRKLFVGTSNDVLAFETHAVVALAYQQLAISRRIDAEQSERLQLGVAGAIEYMLDYRKRGRTYDTAGGWPVNSMAYNRNRPDRRCTAWQLLLLKTHSYVGADVDTTAMTEAPNFILAAQRQAPEMDAELQVAKDAYDEWLPAMRSGKAIPKDARDAMNRWLEYERKREESGGFGIDTIGIVTPSATAVGLWTLGMFEPDAKERYASAATAYQRMPMSWDAQRFFMTQFYATRGLHLYTERYGVPDYWVYLNRLVTLMEQQQSADGSFPLGSRGVEELTQMEKVYTTAMCVLILNADRGTLLFDQPPY